MIVVKGGDGNSRNDGNGGNSGNDGISGINGGANTASDRCEGLACETTVTHGPPSQSRTSHDVILSFS